MTSPPLRVMSALKTWRFTVLRMKRTDPSQNRALNPSRKWPPSRSMIGFGFSRGLSSSKASSLSGLVQGTASLASTTAIVLDVPSVMLAILVPLPDMGSNKVPLPANPR